MKYSIDTSAIINGWHKNFPPDVFPALWDKLSELVDQGRLVATEEVKHELKKKDDDVFKWVESHEHMFVPIDSKIQLVTKQILSKYGKLLDTRKNRSSADPFVIALACVEACTVITEEKPTGNQFRPNIPDVCHDMGIHCINLLEFIREQGWVFRI